MRAYERDPTGRSRSRISSTSYSKTDKPFAHKLKSALAWRSTRIIMGSLAVIFILTVMLLLISTKSPSLQIAHSTSSNDTESLQKTMHRVNEQNSENKDSGSLHELRSHRDELAKSLREIDGLLLSQQQHSDSSNPQNDASGNAVGEHSESVHSVDGESASQSKSSGESLSKSPAEIRVEIVGELKWAWKCYKECAWGFDTVHPIACQGTNDAFDMGLAMIDALDTMIIMNSVVCSILCFQERCQDPP